MRDNWRCLRLRHHALTALEPRRCILHIEWGRTGPPRQRPPRTRKQTHSQNAHKHALKHTHTELDTHLSIHTRTLTSNEAHSHQLARAQVTASAAQRGARHARASRGYHTVHALGWSGARPRLLCVACCIAPAPTDGLASPCLRSTRGAQPALVALAHLQQKRPQTAY